MESVSISTRASYSPYSAWKCAGLWSLKYIRTTIPKNRVTSGISSFHFTLSAPAASEAASARATPSAIGTLRTHSLAGQTAVIGVSREGLGLKGPDRGIRGKLPRRLPHLFPGQY